MGEARALIDEALARVRELSSDLRPALLDHLGLLPTLRWLIERYTASTGVRVNFKHAGFEGRFAPQVETAAYRIGFHANADQIIGAVHVQSMGFRQ